MTPRRRAFLGFAAAVLGSTVWYFLHRGEPRTFWIGFLGSIGYGSVIGLVIYLLGRRVKAPQ